ncbi:MAG: TetR/AcrR family transcriptional regulator [Enhydrobacter sp.]|nr:MAG: TetR/AcrR family transcriptional regulator [Enhydrobacter sp.]
MPRGLSDAEIAKFRARLCKAAVRLFAREGLPGVTMRRLAAELGCSPMTPYRYFRDHQDIVAAVRADAFRRFADLLEEAYAAETDPVARARAVGRTFLGFACDEPDLYRLMYDVGQSDEASYPELTRHRARAREVIVRQNAALIDAGLLEGDPVELSHVMWASTHGAIMLHLAGILPPDLPLQSLFESALRMINRSARPRAVRRPATATTRRPARR